MYGQYDENYNFSQQVRCFQKSQESQNLCNCRNSGNCPLDNKCLTSKMVYSAKIITDDQQPSNFYLGFAKQSLRLLLTIPKSFSVIGRMKKIQNIQVHLGAER